MRQVFAKHNSTICLGREGENLAREIIFDVSEWRATYGSGTVQLLAVNETSEIYPVAITEEGDTVHWVITAADTAHEGVGAAELRYYSGETLVKSETWTTFVRDALGDPTGDPPEPYQSWVDDVLEAGNAAAESAARAEEAASKNPKISARGTWLIWSAAEGKYIDTGVSAVGSGVELDTTLTVAGKAADAKAVGEAVDGLARSSASALAGETSRATGAESSLEGEIAAEVARATQAEADLKQQIGERYSKPSGGIPEADLSAAVRQKLNSGGGGAETDPVFSASPAAQITNANISAWNGKQNAISDLSAIRSGAAAGATAVQPEAGKGLFSGSYNDLDDKPTIPAAVTDAHINSLIDAKVADKYTKPVSGIPESDLSETVQTKLNTSGGIDASTAEAGQVPTADGLGSWAWEDGQGGGSTIEAKFTVDEAVDAFFAPFDTSNYSHFLITVETVGSTSLQVSCVSGGRMSNYSETGASGSVAYIECLLFSSSLSYMAKQFITLSRRSNNVSAAVTGGQAIRYETTFSDGFIFNTIGAGTTIIIKGLS